MKIRIHGMVGTNHSWSITTLAYVRAMVEIGGHDIYIKSTNGLEHFPNDLKHLLLPGYHGHLSQGPTDYTTVEGEQIVVQPANPLPEIEDKNRPYDLEICYTIPYQGPRRFYPDSRCRAIIWNFESSILPSGWQRYMDSIDYILPSSQYSYDILAANGFQKEKMLVVPHGVDTRIFNLSIPPFQLKTQKKVKFLHCARPHDRKLHRRVIRGYLDTFSGDDDVCLVLKTSFIKPDPNKTFEVDVQKILEEEYFGRSNPPEIEVIDQYIEHIGSLYTACDCSVSMSSCEGFYLPGLEAMACGCLNILPRHGGQLQYVNDSNSLLVNTGEMKAPITQQYWTAHPDSVVGDPDINHYKELLRYIYENTEKEKERVREAAKKTVKEFNWHNMTKLILDLPIPEKSARMREKKKVLFIVPYNIVGGGEIWVYEAIKQLDRSLFDPEVAFVNGTDESFRTKIKNLGVTIWDIVKEAGLWDNHPNGRASALKVVLESRGYDLIHFYNSFGIYNIIRDTIRGGLHARVVETVHSNLNWPDSMAKVATREPWVTAIVSVTKTLAQKLITHKNKNVVALPQPIDWNRFEGRERNKNILLEHNIPIDKPTIGFVGRLSPEKNIGSIIRCAKSLPNYSFVLVGDGPQFEPLKKAANELPNVYFVGAKNNVEDYYSAFDVLILTSLVEGLPLVILEAMACGTPVVSSNVGGIGEVLFEGFNGKLINNPNDCPSFIKAIQQVVENTEEWQAMSKNSKEFVQKIKDAGSKINLNNVYKTILIGRK